LPRTLALNLGPEPRFANPVWGQRPLSILRILAFGTTVAFSTLAVCFVSADRLAHSGYRPAPPALPVIAAAPAVEPAVTGTIVQGEPAPAPPARAMTGFDTERLNALMRGESLPAPARKR